MNKTLRIMVLATGVLVFGSGLALAKPDKPADMSSAVCPPQAAFMNLPAEKQELFKKIMIEHQDRMGTLRDQVKVKRMELNALSRNPNTQTETISKLAAEIGDLQGKIRADRVALRGQLEKEVGFSPAMMGSGFHDGYGKHDRRAANCPGYRS